MNLGLYIHRISAIHRFPAGYKLLILFLFSSVIFLINNVVALGILLAFVISLFPLSSLRFKEWVPSLKPLILVLGAIFVSHIIFTNWLLGTVTVLKFAVLILSAVLLTLTTRVTDIIGVLERLTKPLSRFGFPAERFSFTMSLTIRFIPVLLAVAAEIREAQAARGSSEGLVSLIAITVPLAIKTLRLADQVSDAIEVRCYDPD